MKRTSSGNTYYWELYRDRGILRRVRKCRRVLKCVREQRIVHSRTSPDDFRSLRRTVIQLPNGEQQELQYEWGTTQTKDRGLNGEPWQGFTEIFRLNTRKGFRLRRRIKLKNSEADIKDEDLQRKVREEMQQ